MKIVLDTSVLIAGLRSNHGAAAVILGAILSGKVTVLMDIHIASEYRDVALRPQQLRSAGRTFTDTKFLLRLLEARAESVTVSFKHRPLSPHPNDDKFIDVAINGNADAIVTNNTRHFVDVTSFGIKVLMPGQALRIMLDGEK
jgi:putative PIN family toxin of toxin-antitoxin system